jgi:hypothetical protein
VNERFERVFPEKRPFFLENASYFTTPIPLLFTRRIVDPQIGIRMTGRQGPYAVAALVVDDEASGSERSEQAVVTAVRATRNAGRDGLVGVFIGTRELDVDANRIAGVDGRFAMGSQWVGVWQAVTTATTRGGRREAAGPAYTARVTRSGRSLSYAAEWHDRGAGFRADAGYVPRTDFRSLDQALGYRFRPSARRLVAWGPDLSICYVWDREGMRLDATLTPRLTFEWAGPVRLALFHSVSQERLRPTDVPGMAATLDTNADRTGVELAFAGFKRFVWSATVSEGATVNLRPVVEGRPDPASDLEATVSVSARIARGLTVDATFLNRHVTGRNRPASILRNDIWRLKAIYQFTPKLGVRLIAEGDSLTANTSLTTLQPHSDATTDVLLTYMATPGRGLFIGVSRHDDRRAPEPGRRVWQMFAKMSYSIQL